MGLSDDIEAGVAANTSVQATVQASIETLIANIATTTHAKP